MEKNIRVDMHEDIIAPKQVQLRTLKRIESCLRDINDNFNRLCILLERVVTENVS